MVRITENRKLSRIIAINSAILMDLRVSTNFDIYNRKLGLEFLVLNSTYKICMKVILSYFGACHYGYLFLLNRRSYISHLSSFCNYGCQKREFQLQIRRFSCSYIRSRADLGIRFPPHFNGSDGKSFSRITAGKLNFTGHFDNFRRFVGLHQFRRLQWNIGI